MRIDGRRQVIRSWTTRDARPAVDGKMAIEEAGDGR